MLTVSGISKSFGSTKAVAEVSLTINPGEIVGLIGENGAGKSTMLAILAGFLRPDSGTIEIDGQPRRFRLPRDAIAAGVGLVHQHLSLVPTFTVREQLELAGWRRRELPPLLARDFDGREVVGQLSLGERQRLEIAKVLVPNPRVLLLDEPTSILAPTEVVALFEILDRLREAGTAIVIVTHKLQEVLHVASRVLVMTDGRIAGTFKRDLTAWSSGSDLEILRAMFSPDRGDEGMAMVPSRIPSTSSVDSPIEPMTVLSAQSMSTVPALGSQQLRGISFQLHAGAVHAVVGVDGQGQRELAEALAGYRPADGELSFDAHDISNWSALARAEAGIGYLVDDRVGEGAVGSFSIAENLILKRPRWGHTQRTGFLRGNEIRARAREVIEQWDVRPADPDVPFSSLSGGNMQRVLTAREFLREPILLIAMNPIHGLDAQSSEVLWERFRLLCGRGGSVLFFTTDLEEALAHGGRVGVIFNGALSPFQAADEADMTSMASMMVNGW